MNLRASTLAAAGAAPLLFVVAITLAVMTGYGADATPGAFASWRFAVVWSLLAASGAAMLAAVWAWGSEADRAPRRLGLGYTGAAALGMVTFVSMQSYLV